MFNAREVECRIRLTVVDKIGIIERYEREGNLDAMLPVAVINNEIVLATGKTSKRVGQVQLKDLYDDLKKDDVDWFQNPEEIVRDRELFLVHLAKWLYEIPAFVKEFEKMYQQDSLRYYKLAVENKYYNHGVLNDGNLMVDFALKRIYGVLLAAEEDESIRERVESIFFNYDTSLRPLIESESIELISRMEHWLYGGYTAISGALFAYLLLNHYVYDGKSAPLVVYIVTIAHATYVNCEERGSAKFFREYVDGDNDPFEFLECTSDYTWKIIREIMSVADVVSIEEEYEYRLGLRDDWPKNTRLANLLSKCPKDDPCYAEIKKARQIVNAFVTNMNKNGLASCRVFHGKALSKAEQQKVLRECTIFVAQLHRKGMLDKKVKVKLSVDTYVAVLLLHFFTQNECEEKQAFFENNNETMFSQVSVLNEQIEKQQHEREQLTAQIAELNDDMRSLQRENKLLKAALKKENKAAEAPYHEEIARLHKQNVSLANKLNEEKEKTTELNLLREFAFDVQSQYFPRGTETAFADRIKGKKIVVVGGHINWRNKLKKKYPEVTVLDGHVETQDISLFDKADFVFLNVSNMNHGVYYKAIGALRGRGIPYDYLGRTINQELYEQEMADILVKHGIH